MDKILFASLLVLILFTGRVQSAAETQKRIDTVCPPFFLKDESGAVINPVAKINDDKPYSPKQTCGGAGCHDYVKITEGYHFTQGAGEAPKPLQAARMQWVSSPGNYGGPWCSPAPLYRYLSPKVNTTPATMDMTSFTFITAGCGNCHPGGGSAEYDRNGNRYDHYMTEAGYTAGGVNDLDGDYYQARWNESGVLEADCMICHLPSYDFKARNAQIAKFNFRWAATAGAGWAQVTGSIQNGEPVQVIYNPNVFDADGKLSPNIVREPRNSACLGCHAQPGWKKRGANFSPRTDVHLRAGVKCVDCHPAGSKALDSRINGYEEHQFSKGDDPGGKVRDDLDNSVIGCDDCHSNGRLGAPIAKHRWLPPLHLDAIACQTCHIPQRLIKSAQLQASDVFNTATKISTKGKRLWSFYGPDMQFYNHYGNLEMMGYDDKPTDPFTPVLARYNGKIYAVNRVHSTWPGIEIEGKEGLMQPKMSDIVKMWEAHQQNPEKYPLLAQVADDNGDGVIEVNRPQEIDALITSVTQLLNDVNYPLDGKRVVWVMNDRVYSSGREFRTVPKESWEASPYANVHKYSHDVFPARSALGANGCLDCHGRNSHFFMSRIVRYPFDDDAQPVYMMQYRLLGISPFYAWIGIVRESYLKPLIFAGLFMLLLIPFALGSEIVLRWIYGPHPMPKRLALLPLALVAILSFAVVVMIGDRQLASYILPSRLWLDANHFALAMVILTAGLLAVVYRMREIVQKRRRNHPALRGWTNELLISFIVVIASGVMMMVKLPGLSVVTRLAYSLFDFALLAILIGALYTFYARIIKAAMQKA